MQIIFNSKGYFNTVRLGRKELARFVKLINDSNSDETDKIYASLGRQILQSYSETVKIGKSTDVWLVPN